MVTAALYGVLAIGKKYYFLFYLSQLSSNMIQQELVTTMILQSKNTMVVRQPSRILLALIQRAY